MAKEKNTKTSKTKKEIPAKAKKAGTAKTAKKEAPKGKKKTSSVAKKPAPKAKKTVGTKVKKSAPVKSSACPKDMPWVSTYIAVRNVKDSVAFYEKAFGLHCRLTIEGKDGGLGHAEFTYQDGVIMIGRESPEMDTKSNASLGGSPVTLYIYVEKVDDFFQKAVSAGATAITPPVDMYWGDRMCVLGDIDGLKWSFATHIGAK